MSITFKKSAIDVYWATKHGRRIGQARYAGSYGYFVVTDGVKTTCVSTEAEARQWLIDQITATQATADSTAQG